MCVTNMQLTDGGGKYGILEVSSPTILSEQEPIAIMKLRFILVKIIALLFCLRTEFLEAYLKQWN